MVPRVSGTGLKSNYKVTGYFYNACATISLMDMSCQGSLCCTQWSSQLGIRSSCHTFMNSDFPLGYL